jgi:Flp pilus assembly protein TadB
MNLLLIATAIAFGAFGYLAFMSIALRGHYKSLTVVERTEAERQDADVYRPKGLGGRLRAELVRRGYDGDPLPALVVGGFGYLLMVTVLRLVSVPVVAAVALALVAACSVATGLLRTVTLRRRRLFEVQLVEALSALAGRLESGSSVSQAFAEVLPNLRNPLHDEFARARDASVSMPLYAALEQVRRRYPSRPFAMLVTAIQLSDTQGARIAPTLREAAAALTREQELQAEAVAEVSQARGEFMGIVAIIASITAFIVFAGEDTMRTELLSPVGLTLLVIGVANFAWGVRRSLKIFARAKGVG